MILYYGADSKVIKPEYLKGSQQNDYGLGFYMTPEYDKAKIWASKFSQGGYLIKYEVDLEGLDVLHIDGANEQVILKWATLLISNRFDSRTYDLYKGTIEFLQKHFPTDLDFVEFIAQGIKTVIKGKYHDYFSHYELSFIDDNKDFESFRAEINEAFDMCGLLYNLTEERIVERIVDDGFIIEESKTLIETVPEKELKKLIEESIKLHKSRNPDDCHLATEKIWDALERLKTIYIDEETDKKASATKVISQMANSDEDYINLFSTEFVYLTNVGNNYRIRHHEIGKKDIPDDGYYDYFFSRCFSLIMLALKYIK